MTKYRDALATPRNLVIMGSLGLLLSYALATRAIDTGSLGQYGLVLVTLIFSVRLLAKALKISRNGKIK